MAEAVKQELDLVEALCFDEVALCACSLNVLVEPVELQLELTDDQRSPRQLVGGRPAQHTVVLLVCFLVIRVIISVCFSFLKVHADSHRVDLLGQSNEVLQDFARGVVKYLGVVECRFNLESEQVQTLHVGHLRIQVCKLFFQSLLPQEVPVCVGGLVVPDLLRIFVQILFVVAETCFLLVSLLRTVNNSVTFGFELVDLRRLEALVFGCIVRRARIRVRAACLRCLLRRFGFIRVAARLNASVKFIGSKFRELLLKFFGNTCSRLVLDGSFPLKFRVQLRVSGHLLVDCLLTVFLLDRLLLVRTEQQIDSLLDVVVPHLRMDTRVVGASLCIH